MRLGLNADYDRVQELANQHRLVLQMRRHSDWANDHRYSLQTLKDNCAWSRVAGSHAGAIGLGGLGNESYDFRSVGHGFHCRRSQLRS
ncbi:hypothetical protein CCR91_03925 [Thiorhodovibrio winogradskyi]|nr:hypothetical protein [Thiorhodovibrio winogradskyi]